MDKIQEELLGLLSACKKCLTPCCNDKYFLSLPGERESILAEGYPDHFTKVQTERGDFYVLDFQGDDCAYLGENGCTITDVRPSTCRAYPAYINSNGEVAAHPSCRSYEQVTEGFLKNAEPLLVKYNKAYPDDVYAYVIKEYKKQRESSLKKH